MPTESSTRLSRFLRKRSEAGAAATRTYCRRRWRRTPSYYTPLLLLFITIAGEQYRSQVIGEIVAAVDR